MTFEFLAEPDYYDQPVAIEKSCLFPAVSLGQIHLTLVAAQTTSLGQGKTPFILQQSVYPTGQ